MRIILRLHLPPEEATSESQHLQSGSWLTVHWLCRCAVDNSSLRFVFLCKKNGIQGCGFVHVSSVVPSLGYQDRNEDASE